MNYSIDILPMAWKKISPPCRACLFASVISGFLAHYYMLSNKITNWDDEMCPPGVGGGEFFGRWLEYDANRLFTRWSVPGVNGVMAVLLLAAAACFIVSVLSVRTITGGVLTGIVIMTFPSVACNLYYMYAAAGYSLAILMACAGVWCTKQRRHGWIAGVLLQILSMAIYQAYFSLAASLYVILVIIDTLSGKDIRLIVRNAVRYFLTLLVSIALYLVSIRAGGFTMIEYKGMDQIGQASARDYILAFLRSYHRVLQYFVTLPPSFVSRTALCVSRVSVLLLLVLIFAVYLVCRRHMPSVPARIGYWCGMAILPFGLGLVYVMAPTIDHASTVMTFSYVLLYLLILVLAEILASENIPGTRSMLSRFLFIVSGCLVLWTSYLNFRIDNNAYYRTWLAQQRVLQQCSRIMMRLEEQPGYHYGDPVYFLGTPESVTREKLIFMDEDIYADMEGAAGDQTIFMEANRNRFIATWLGIDTGNLYGESFDAMMQVKDSEEYRSIPSYPADGCVRRIDDVWIVKLGGR